MENDKKCQPGFRWCPIAKKCKPMIDEKGKGRRMGRGKGEGPMGKPTKEAHDLVDLILSGDYSLLSIAEKVDSVLDEVDNQIDPVPDQDLDQLQNDITDELSTDSLDRAEEEAEQQDVEEPVEEQTTIEEKMKQAVQLLVTEETYREFFKGMLKKWNITSPSDLEGDKKKIFFNKIDKLWKAKKETD